MSIPVIQAKQLTQKSGNTYLLKDIDIDVYPGQHWIIFGNNGSGKTTLLNILAGFQKPTSGELMYLGNQYSETITLAPEVFDGSNKDYLILFNGKPANNIDSKSGQISGDVSMTFYDLEGKEITTANFNVAIQYYVTQTVITISMTNEKDSVSYLSHYANTNGAVISVVERSVA